MGLFLIVLFFGQYKLSAQQITATEIVRKTDEKLNGEMTGYSVMSMTIIRSAWQRTVEATRRWRCAAVWQ